MPRVKRGVQHNKRRNAFKKRVKGFRGGRKTLIKLVKTADMKAGAHAYRDRKLKKRENRKLWNVKINAALRSLGSTYSKFIGALKKNNVSLDRKVLSQLAEDYPNVFEKVAETTK